MKSVQYHIVFSVEVLHAYFKSGKCSCLSFIPDEATAALMKRFDFVLRHNSNVFALYSSTALPISDYLRYISSTTGQSSFIFNIQSANSSFNAFTDLPVNWIGELLYDSKNNAGYSNAGSTELNHALSENKNTVNTGKLVIHFDDLAALSTEGNEVSFRIRFNVRLTQWQYFVINKSAVPFHQLLISGDDQIHFKDPEPVVILSGEQALLFSSGDQLLPLSEVPNFQFSLVNNLPLPVESLKKKANTKIIFKGLPHPDPDKTGMVTVNGKRCLSSPMYVYV